MFKPRGTIFTAVAILGMATVLSGAGRLFYLEGQAVAGYTSASDGVIFYSMAADDAMQKPSLGFDYVERFSGEAGDWGALALQGRVAYDQEGAGTVQPQLYNAFFKYKAGFSDLWLGHNRPAFGLSSYLDNHGTLLQPLAMYGFGFDRDWGLGFYRDAEHGSIGFSATTGSGMPLHLKGNYLLSVRLSHGVLNQDNYTLGVSAGLGKTLATMGYHLMSDGPVDNRLIGLDATHLWGRMENRIDAVVGSRGGQKAYAALWRGSVNMFSEGRLKAELQPVYRKTAADDDLQLQAGLSFQATSNIALCAVYGYDRNAKNSQITTQVYYYRKL